MPETQAAGLGDSGWLKSQSFIAGCGTGSPGRGSPVGVREGRDGSCVVPDISGCIYPSIRV